jgi:antitoxin (DNA-binding transcriptional repressor) of toxin-antitoxin stability system
MKTANMLEARSSLSRHVPAVETGEEDEIVIARNGCPASGLVAVGAVATGQRIGVAKGKFTPPDDIDANNPLIKSLFTGSAE